MIVARNVKQGSITRDRLQGVLNVNPWSRTLYVSSTHTRATDLANNTGLKPDMPLKTLVKALALARPNDVILVGAGHTETVSKLDTAAVTNAGVNVIGFGSGAKQPVIHFAPAAVGTTSTWAAPDMLFENIRLNCDFDGITNMVTVTGAGVTLAGCKFTQTTAKQAVTTILLNAVRFTMRGCRIVLSEDGGTSFLAAGGVVDELTIRECSFRGDWGTAIIFLNGNAAANIIIIASLFNNADAAGSGVALGAGVVTGDVALNAFRVSTDNASNWITFSGSANVTLNENYGVNDVNETGKLIGVVTVVV